MDNLKIIEIRPEIRANVEANNGYCPCAIWQTEDTKCMCREFREQTEPGECHCGRFEKVVENEKRLIYADALMASLRESLDELRKIGDGLSYHEDKQICNGQICTFLEAIMRVREQPTVDAVEVVHGRWIEDVATDMIACTECGHAWNIIDNCTETFNYCPNCGAKMDGERRTDG